MKTPNTKENCEHFLNADYDEDKLTVWEIDFLQSVRSHFYAAKSLSDKQFAILERIYAEKSL